MRIWPGWRNAHQARHNPGNGRYKYDDYRACGATRRSAWLSFGTSGWIERFMKRTSLIPIVITAALLCSCAAYRSAWRTNGELQVRIHAPEDMIGQHVTYYVDDKPVITTTNLVQNMSLVPKKNRIRVEMAGAKPVEESIKIAGNGSKQVLDITLAKE
jgi:hypothetical protein